LRWRGCLWIPATAAKLKYVLTWLQRVWCGHLLYEMEQ